MTRKKYLSHKKCNICQNSNSKIVYDLGKQKLVECVSCNLLYLNKQRVDLKNLYNEDYFFKSESYSTNYFNYDGNEQLLESDFEFAYNYINNNYKKFNFSGIMRE